MNQIALIDELGKLTEAVIDLDAVEPIWATDTPRQRADKIAERLNHVRAVMEACDAYVETIMNDTREQNWLHPRDGLTDAYNESITNRVTTRDHVARTLTCHAKLLNGAVDLAPRPPRRFTDVLPSPESAGKELLESLRALEESAGRLRVRR